MNEADTQVLSEPHWIDRDTLAGIATDAAAAMFSLPLSVVDETDDAHLAQTHSGASSRHVVILRLHGVPAIFLSLACSHAAGAEIASVIFEVDRKHADASMIDDSLRELANIFAGQVKSMMAPDHEIGLPRVQKDLTALHAHDWHGVSLRIGEGEQVLDLAVAA